MAEEVTSVKAGDEEKEDRQRISQDSGLSSSESSARRKICDAVRYDAQLQPTVNFVSSMLSLASQGAVVRLLKAEEGTKHAGMGGL